MIRGVRTQTQGLAAAIVANVLGGAVMVATRAVTTSIDPLLLATLRYLIGALILVPISFWVRHARIARRDWPAVAALGVLIFALVPYLLNVALQYTTASRGAIALSTYPLFTALFAAVLRIEAISARTLVGVFLAMAGVAIALSERTSGGAHALAWVGDLTMLTAAALGSLYSVLSRDLLQRYGSLTVTSGAMIAGTLALSVTALFFGQLKMPHLPATDWGMIGFLGLFGAAASFWLWSFALRHSAPTPVAITVTLNPVTAVLLGWGLLGEPKSVNTLVGLLAVVAGIAMGASVQGRAGDARAMRV